MVFITFHISVMSFFKMKIFEIFKTKIKSYESIIMRVSWYSFKLLCCLK